MYLESNLFQPTFYNFIIWKVLKHSSGQIAKLNYQKSWLINVVELKF